MGIIMANTFVTLDGVMQAPGAPDEDRSGGFDRGGWLAPYWSEESGPVVMEQYERGSALLIGRRTWEIFSSFWPHAPADDPMAARLNGMPKYVVSDSLKKADWNGSAIVRGKDLKAQVAKLKAEPGDVHVVGSSNLLQTLIREDLVDRYVVWTFPVILGSGKKLFPDEARPLALRLESSRRFPTGVVVNEFVRDGEVRFATVGQEN